MKVLTSLEVIAYGHVDATGVATDVTELSYALGADYPAEVVLVPKGGYAMGRNCALDFGTLTWSTLVVEGTAVTASLEGGSLHLTLREEGDASLLLEGNVDQQHCSGNAVVPLHQRINVHVHRVAGFTVDTLHQYWVECETKVVLPADAPLWVPVAHAMDAEGRQFEPANAPSPVQLTLRSSGALSPAPNAWEFTAAPGHVTISLETALPVQGLSSFEVVGPDALTEVQAALYLRKAASKGSVSEALEDGGSYRLFFPGQDNAVTARVETARTAGGRLCANVPAAWFSAVSSTPEQCGSPPVSDEPFGDVAVAAVRALGECRLEVTIPETAQRWAARFTTTR